MKHGKYLDEEDVEFASFGFDGSRLDLWTLEAEKYRVGVLHEFLRLTLEKSAFWSSRRSLV